MAGTASKQPPAGPTSTPSATTFNGLPRDARQDLEDAIDLLRQALETFDFAALRARHPALAGPTDHRIALHRDPRGHLDILIGVRPLPDPPIK